MTLKSASTGDASSTFASTYTSPASKLAPPPVLSSAKIALSLLVYIGADTFAQSCVSVLYCLILQFAPPFGAVVLIHKLPVGAGLVSATLYSGTLVCGAIVALGALYVPSLMPNAPTPLVPSVSDSNEPLPLFKTISTPVE